jgi:Mlc titration factor MtfA (ptsG expression regulator)
MLDWFKKRRRDKILARPWPDEWSEYLKRNVRLSWGLRATEADMLRQRIKVLVAEKHWEGCDGLEITDEMRVTVAANASLMLLGVADYYFDKVQTILMFPRAFRRQAHDGWITDEVHRAGEAWQGGPIVLSWDNVLRGSRDEDDGHNVVVHEFAHVLDGLDGEMGGSLMFDDHRATEQWARVVEKEYGELCDSQQHGRRTLLDHYGAKNRAEFFAVASETFFEQPGQLKSSHAELFELLRKYYHVDPSTWQRR